MTAAEVPELVETADHIAGFKILDLRCHDGSVVPVTIRRLTYTETLSLPRTEAGHVDPLEILKASLPPDFPFERLDREVLTEDCDRAHLTALYLSWGAERQKKMHAAATRLAEAKLAVMTGAASSNSNATASAPATASPKSDPGLCPASFSSQDSSSAPSGGSPSSKAAPSGTGKPR